MSHNHLANAICESCRCQSATRIKRINGVGFVYCNGCFDKVTQELKTNTNKISAKVIQKFEKLKELKRRPYLDWAPEVKRERRLICRKCDSEVVPGTAWCPQCGRI